MLSGSIGCGFLSLGEQLVASRAASGLSAAGGLHGLLRGGVGAELHVADWLLAP